MQFNITIPANLPRVMGDPERVLQIITNLLENAYDYTPVGGKIELTASQSNGSVQVDIIDNGIGVKERAVIRDMGIFQKPGTIMTPVAPPLPLKEARRDRCRSLGLVAKQSWSRIISIHGSSE